MNILFVNFTPIYGGGEEYLKNVINKFAQFDDVFLITPPVKALLDNLIIKTENVTTINPNTLFFFHGVIAINKIIKEKSIDIVFLNGNRTFFTAPFLRIRKKIAVKHTSLQINSGIKSGISISLLKFSLKSISKLVLISQFHKQEVLKKKICTEDKIKVIYNGVTIKAANSSSQKNNDSICISIIGRLQVQKGHLDLLLVIEKLLRKFPNLVLWVVGDGPEKERISKFITKRGLEQNVNLLGFRKDIDNILQETDIFVLPSYSEGLPLSLLEAMTQEIPSIATSVGGIPEIISDNNFGFLYPPGNLEQLEVLLEMLITSPSLRKSVGKRARMRVLEKFDEKIMIQNLKALVKELTSDNKK